MKQNIIKECNECSHANFQHEHCLKKNMVISHELDNEAIHPSCPLPDWEERGWISVEDRLPENCKLVLMCSTIRAIDIGEYIEFYKTWHTNTGKIFEKREVKTVTHWMPLPKKPDAVFKKGEGL